MNKAAHMEIIIKSPATLEEWNKENPERWKTVKRIIPVNDIYQISIHKWGDQTGMRLFEKGGAWHFTTNEIKFI